MLWLTFISPRFKFYFPSCFPSLLGIMLINNYEKKVELDRPGESSPE